MLTNLAAESHADHPPGGRGTRGGRAFWWCRRTAAVCVAPTTPRLRRSELIAQLLREEGKDPVTVVGRRPGLLQLPQLEDHRVVDRVLRAPTYENARRSPSPGGRAFLAGADDDRRRPSRGQHPRGRRTAHRVHRFRSMLSQTAEAPDRADGVENVEEDDGPHAVLLRARRHDTVRIAAAALRRARIFAALLEAAASESASRRRAMKAASDNADDLIKALTRWPTGSGRPDHPGNQRNRRRRKRSRRRQIDPTQKRPGANKHDRHR